MKRRRRSPEPRRAIPRAVRKYSRRGWSIFPVAPNGKEPLFSASDGGKGFRDATSDLEQLRMWWLLNPSANIGFFPGPSGLVVLDVDGREGEETAERLGLNSVRTLEVRTGKGRHLYFHRPLGAARIGNKPLGAGIDVRADNGYVLVPPSVHPNGSTYSWVDPSTPVAPLPAAIADRLIGRVSTGARNTMLAQYLGKLRSEGVDEAGLIAAGLVYNKRHCDPELSEAEVRTTAKSIARYAPRFEDPENVLRQFNAQFGIVQLGGKARILDERRADVLFLGKEEFRLLFSNRFVAAGTGQKGQTVADYWLAHRERREFSSVVFEPGHQRTKGAYNIWSGWGVRAKRGNCSLFLAHLEDNICGGDRQLYRWVLEWVAHLFQRPTEKPGSSLVLLGQQGTGKTILGKIIGKLVGRSYRLVANARRVTGQFNPHLEGCLLLQADEAFWAGDQSAAGTLKDLVTNNVQWIERKGVDSIEVPNYIRLLVTSNADWAVPAGLEERRFCVLRVANKRRQDTKYFGELMRQMERGGYEALLHCLLHLKLGKANLRVIPKTTALFTQKVASMSPELAWLFDVLKRGSLPGDREGRGIAPREVIYDDYVRHAQRTGAKRRTIETTLGMFLKKFLPQLRRTKPLVRGHRGAVACYEFPQLQACRAVFDKATGHGGRWEKPLNWQPSTGRPYVIDS